MTVEVKIIETPLGYGAEIMSGYRAGHRICHGCTDLPVTWPNRLAAVHWLRSTGYTIINEEE